MITADVLSKNIKNGKIDNLYILCGIDEELILESARLIAKQYVKTDSSDLNFTKIDGVDLTVDILKNSCETMPFFSEKRVVLVQRANFFKDKCDTESNKIYEDVKEYIKDIPEFTVLIMYYVLNDKRKNPKKIKKIMALDKDATVVNVEKLKRDGFIKKVSEIFAKNKADISNIEIRYFCEKVPTNLDIVNSEVQKLIAYTNGRPIKREDINKLLPRKSEDDIFDLVDLISQRKIEKAMDIMDELLFKGDQHMLIITAIENQFKTLYNVKALLNEGNNIDSLTRILNRPRFVCEKLSSLSKKFTRKQLEGLLKLCLETENSLKTNTSDKQAVLELLLIKTLMVKKN